MAEVKLALIIDKSEAYISFQLERVLKQWQVKREDATQVASLTSVGVATLFGGAPTALMELSDVDAVKKLNEELAAHDQASLLESFSSGLIVYTHVPRTSTKKLEEAFKKLGATVYTPPAKNDAPLGVKLLSELNLTRQVKDFLLNYVGEDYDALLPLVESISELPKAVHPRITEQDIFARFPQEKGAVAPWEIEKPLLAGDVGSTIDVLRRVNKHSHFLVVLSVLKNKFQLAYRLSELLKENPRITDAEVGEVLGLKSTGQVGFLKRGMVKTYSTQTLQEVVKILAECEAGVKGGSAAPSLALMEASVVRICLLLKGARA